MTAQNWTFPFWIKYMTGLRLGTWDSFLWICVHTDATHIWVVWCHEHNQMSDACKQIRWNDLNGHCWGIKQTVEFKSISILSYSNFQGCFKVISLSLMVGESGNYWKLAIWGFCNWRKFNYKVELDLDCSPWNWVYFVSWFNMRVNFGLNLAAGNGIDTEIGGY